MSLPPKTPTIAPYGSWASPVLAADLAGTARSFSDLRREGETLYWVEDQPDDGGHHAVMRLAPGGAAEPVTPPGFDVRSRVHEYGGTPFAVHGGTVYFVHFADQRLYRQAPGTAPVAMTHNGNLRYADLVIDTAHRRLLAVREDHRLDGDPVNTLVALPLDGAHEGEKLVEGSDFVAYPAPSPDGRHLAWISWDHPNMPWDSVSLWVAEVSADGSLRNHQCLNGDVDDSVLQPEWGPDGALYFISDRSDWWNLYRWHEGRITAIHPRASEFGGPLWRLGDRHYGFLADGRLAVKYGQDGRGCLGLLDPVSGALTVCDVPRGGEPETLCAHGGTIDFVVSYRDDLGAILRYDVGSGSAHEIRDGGHTDLRPAYISIAESITFPTSGGEVAHGYHYPPTNPDYAAPEGECPPLIVMLHGGPTGSSHPRFSFSRQYWTTRGFAVLDVNYRGSTGYGRAYRRRLNGEWGIIDVDDAIHGALYLAEQGLADRDRLLIQGGSAGGFMVLSAMAFHDVFAAGANHFGVSDLEALVRDTHKFESRYFDNLVGPYPERRDIYIARSPIHHLDRFNRPLITIQGLDDRVVPPAQSEAIVNALRKKGVPVAYLAFEGEQHGLRKAENRARAQDAELSFYGQILGFTPAGPIAPVPIDNL